MPGVLRRAGEATVSAHVFVDEWETVVIEVLTTGECAVCRCHDITTRERIVGGQPWQLCNDCRSQIKRVPTVGIREEEKQDGNRNQDA